MGFDTVTRSHVGCRRKLNEDAVLSRPENGLWSVADGMGGHHAGDVASALVIGAAAGCSPAGDLAERADALTRALLQANARLFAMGAGQDAQRTIGSTVVALLIGADGYVCLWAGDSRAYLLRGGTLRQLTRDHSLVQDLVDAGMIEPADAQSHPDGNIITRAVGAGPGLLIDRVEGSVLAGDAFLLASDGLTRLASEAELLAALSSPSLEEAADDLIDACLERDAPDNVSFVMLRVS